MFWNNGKNTENTDKNTFNSKEYEKLVIRLVDLNSKLDILENKFKLLETDVANLRGNFNVRLKAIKERDIEGQKENTETIIKDEFVAFG